MPHVRPKTFFSSSTAEQANTKAAPIFGSRVRRSASKWGWGGSDRWDFSEFVLQRFSFEDVGHGFHVQLQYLCEVVELLPFASLRIHEQLKMLWKVFEFTKHLVLVAIQCTIGLRLRLCVAVVITLA